MTRLIDWLAGDLGLAPSDVVAAFRQLPAAVLVLVVVWFAIAVLFAVAA